MAHIGRSACDQCSYCTEFCPRYLLGYEVQPHKVMRSLGFTLTGGDIWNQWSELCCACGLCTLYACPEDLYPKEACDSGKQSRRAAGLKFVQQAPVQVHPMKEYRRVPLSQLRRRLQVEEYERETRAFPGFRCKRLKMIRLGRLTTDGTNKPVGSMFHYAGGAGFKALAKQPFSFAAERRVCLEWRGPTRRTGPACHGRYPAVDGRQAGRLRPRRFSAACQVPRGSSLMQLGTALRMMELNERR
jgi:ferredoxin